MRSSFSLFALASCLCALQATAMRVKRSGPSNGLSDYESFSSGGQESNRPLRAPQDIRTVQSSKRVAQSPSHSSRTPTNIVYGKGRHAEQPKYGSRPQVSQKPKAAATNNQYKFQASPEDSAYESDSNQNQNQNQYGQQYKLNSQDAAALQKYMQKYANQLYSAQKHATQLSESQKFVLGQDPYSKKFMVPHSQQHKFGVPKFIPLANQEAKTTATPNFNKYQEDSFESVEPVTTEKYQSFQLQQKLVVGSTKATKTPPKKAYSYSVDNTPQSTDHKYSNLYGSSLDPQAVNQILSSYGTQGSQDRGSLSSFDTHHGFVSYGTALSDKGEHAKITGYKIPGAVSLSLGHGHAVEEKGHQEHGHEEPHAEPKYEYMYQVKDPEKHNHFGHSEVRKGKTTWGRYYVQLPDGRFETVKYWADKSGYHAEVDYKGHAKHPSPKEHGHGHGHGHGYDRLEDVQSETGGTSYIANSFKGYEKIGEAGLGSHQDYNVGEQPEDYQ